ncbi:hypothetical protein EC973_003467 [Apophysomyces ossiformis]|uniref:Uncharacterized protein n=1 Tax=Apophysomyces ossiformis TaxID=679940 RepID=A0A8H7BH82_9FUNG|nr:hypothetical protein EC973_003467 [Apophysomyces ossiformis]
MKLFILLCICAFALSISLVKAEIVSPLPNVTWYAGTRETVAFDTTGYTSNDTVTLFFDEDRSKPLAYGQVLKGNFTFVVPVQALSVGSRDKSHLLAVVRRNFYLWKVFALPVKVIMPPGNVLQVQDSPSPVRGASIKLGTLDQQLELD